ncbi:ADP-heptose synthase / D-glycero-beta-D-manno-heptose 7-phosphate kinase [hydrothermal vent metagenome]|uniref:ADP-heptose synthase / D-glycero-beta-D-manno-heptose 7-phosphate kinase n=1 Tax=hydrothermal vent metagenome TaxID=652676 RepID=A0A3B1CKS2_9ZZZZ
MDLTTTETEELLKKIRDAKIAIYGDFCLDSYWILDPRGSEVSVETGLQAQAVVEQRYSLGGASNVAANVAALKPKELRIFGIAGDDIFGKEMIKQLKEIGANTDGLIIQNEKFETYTFCKLILDGVEQPRLDFGTYNHRSIDSDNKVLENLKNTIDDVDIVILNQQVPHSITNISFIDGLNNLIAEHPEKIFIVDSRYYTDKFKNVSLKANDIEAAKLLNENSDGSKISEDELKKIASELSKNYNRPIFITLGENGILAAEGENIYRVPGLVFNTQLDIVGAGDTVLSALACSLAAGAEIQEAIEFANFAAGVTVQKLYTTGTASAEEILEVCANPIYNK